MSAPLPGTPFCFSWLCSKSHHGPSSSMKPCLTGAPSIVTAYVTYFAISVLPIPLSFIFYVWVLLLQIDFRLLGAGTMFHASSSPWHLPHSLVVTICWAQPVCLALLGYSYGITLTFQIRRMKLMEEKWLVPSLTSRPRISIWVSLVLKPSISPLNDAASTCGWWWRWCERWISRTEKKEGKCRWRKEQQALKFCIIEHI